MIHFGPWRDERSSQVALLLPADTRAPSVEAGDFALTALWAATRCSRPKRFQSAWTGCETASPVDVCVDLREQPRTPNGTHTAQLIYVGDAANIPPVPVDVSIQARYLWGLVPGIWVLAALAMWVAFDKWPGGPKRQVTSFIGVAAPIASVLSVQGLRSPGWGGLTAVVGLLAAMYVAGQTAAGVIKQGGHDLAEKSVSNRPPLCRTGSTNAESRAMTRGALMTWPPSPVVEGVRRRTPEAAAAGLPTSCQRTCGHMGLRACSVAWAEPQSPWSARQRATYKADVGGSSPSAPTRHYAPSAPSPESASCHSRARSPLRTASIRRDSESVISRSRSRFACW